MKLQLLAAIICLLGFSTGLSLEIRQATKPATDVSTAKAQGPTLFKELQESPYGRWIPFLTRFFNFLNEPQVSSKFNSLIASREQILQQALGCGEKRIVAYLNSPNTTFGRLVLILRMGQGPLSSLRELNSIAIKNIPAAVWLIWKNLNFNAILKELENLIQSMSSDCLKGDLKKYKDDVEYILQKFREVVLQAPTS